MMEMVNEMYDYTSGGKLSHNTQLPVLRSAINALTLLIAPFAPHFAEELRASLGNKTSIANEKWPQYDAEAIVASEVTIVIQVNGKVRSKLTMPVGASDKEAEAAALADLKVREYTQGKLSEEGHCCSRQACEYRCVVRV